MASDEGLTDLVELRPAPAVLLRHRNADLDVVTAPRTGPRVELRRGALWIRAGEDGPGVTVTHGAASVQVRAGAGVVEVLDMEALLVVASGRAAIKGVSPLPRSVIAGQAVTLTLDGTFTDPDPLSAAELAADRMVVENLALDSLASSASATAPAPAAAPAPVPAEVEAQEEEPLPTRVPGATTEARVDHPRAPQVEPTSDPFAPRVRPEPEPASAEPAPTAPPVGRPAPSLPAAEPSALETALAGVGVTDVPLEPGETRTPVEPKSPDGDDPSPAPAKGRKAKPPKPPKEPKGRKAKEPKVKEPKGRKAKEPRTRGPKSTGPKRPTGKQADDPEAAAPPAPEGDDRRRTRILVALVLGALLILAIVAAVAFSTDDAGAAAVIGAPLLAARLRPLVV